MDTNLTAMLCILHSIIGLSRGYS